MKKGIDASGLMPGFIVHVAIGRKKAEKAADRMGHDKGLLEGGAVTVYTEGQPECLVCFLDDYGADEMGSVACHEAVHCASAWLAFMSEPSPGEEVMAYMVQACYDAIMEQL